MKLIALLAIFALPFTQSKPDQKILLLDGKVQLLVPKELPKITDQMWNTKYPGKAKPLLGLSDENGEINLIADMTDQPVTESQMGAFKDFQLQQIKQRRHDAEFLEDGIKTINGKKVSYFKFLSKAIDQKVFNYFFFVNVHGKVLLFTFNCIEKLRKDWEKTADDIVSTLKVN
ncbi:MAG: hypothetical protein ABUT20_43105 [Bacteroidota bacterium]